MVTSCPIGFILFCCFCYCCCHLKHYIVIIRRKTSETVQSQDCLERQANDTEIILETLSREVSSDNDDDTSNNANSNEVDTVMESSSNNDGTTYNPADAPPAYPDVVDHDDSESLPSYSELGDGYSYV